MNYLSEQKFQERRYKEVVLIPRVELGTSPLPRVRSTNWAISAHLERAAGIEPASSAWKAEVIAIIRCPHPGTLATWYFCSFWITRWLSYYSSLPDKLTDFRLKLPAYTRGDNYAHQAVIACCFTFFPARGRDGGGRRIRTFEVCDGRFTVCSLWPLGNPTLTWMVPTTGIELVTYWLQVSCSTYWAKSASSWGAF